MATLGIIGGGQLAMFICQEAIKMNIKTVILDPNNNCPASKICSELIVGEFTDLKKFKKLHAKVDFITYEFENIPHKIIKEIEDKVFQTHVPLMLSQNRITEKDFAKKSGMMVPNYSLVTSEAELNNAISKIGYPCILKTTALGYDGKGQIILNSKSDLKNVEKIINEECVLEEFIKFDFELSVIIITNNIDTVWLPIAKNTHRNGILFKTEVIENIVNKKLINHCKNFVEKINCPGIYAIELFVSGNNIYFNEFAPRPHNSGHYSIDGCDKSQNRLLLECLFQKKLTQPKLLYPSVMINILGKDYEYAKEYFKNKIGSGIFHDYFKKKIRENRKMGHVTFFANSKECVENDVKKFIEGMK